MPITVDSIKKAMAGLCRVIIANEVYFCELDSAAGDGDFGMSLAKGFKQVEIQLNDIDSSSPAKFLRQCSMIVAEFCGGASGPIWGSGLGAAAGAVKGKEELSNNDVVAMFRAAVEGMQKRGGAVLGDKTLLDALIPAIDALEASLADGKNLPQAFQSAASAALLGAEKTKNMVAKKGRATYVGERSLEHPDAGAMAVAVILKSLA